MARPRLGFVQSLRSASPQLVLALGLLLALSSLSLRIVLDQRSRSALRAPVCRALAPSGVGLPKLVLFLGTEGGGHDLLELVFASLPANLSLERFDPGLHLTSAESQVTSAAADGDGPAREECPKLPYARRAVDFGMLISAAMREKAPNGSSIYTYVRARDPMPMGRVRTPLARVDPVTLGTFHGLYYDLKVLVLCRDLAQSALWSISREFHNQDVGLQLRLIEDSLTYLDASIRTLPCPSYAVLNVDLMQGNQEVVAEQLAEFLLIPNVGRQEVSTAIQVALSRWQEVPQGRQVSPEPTFGGQDIGSFFSQRSGLWPLLNAMKKTAFFAPRTETSWPS